MRVKKASPFGVFPLIKGLATNISFKKKHDKQCRPNDYLGIWGGFLNFTHFGMWRVPIIFHHPQLPYIYQTYWRYSRRDDTHPYELRIYDIHTIHIPFNLSCKYLKNKNVTNGEKPRNDVGYCSFGSSRVGPQGQFDRSLPGYLKENILDITTSWVSLMIIPCSSTSIQQLRNIYNKKCNKWSPGIRNKSGCRWNKSLFNISSVLAFQQNHAKPLYKSVWHLVERRPCIAVHRGSTYVRTTGRGFTL